jgi:hypothetical protein
VGNSRQVVGFAFLKGGPGTATVSPGPPRSTNITVNERKRLANCQFLQGGDPATLRALEKGRRQDFGYVSKQMVGEMKLRPASAAVMAGMRSDAIRGLIT